MHFLANFEWNSQGRSEWFSGLQRLSLGARDNQRGFGKPSGGTESLNARGADGTQAPRPHRDMWINFDLRVCQVAHECCHPRLSARARIAPPELSAMSSSAWSLKPRRGGVLTPRDRACRLWSAYQRLIMSARTAVGGAPISQSIQSSLRLRPFGSAGQAGFGIMFSDNGFGRAATPIGLRAVWDDYRQME